MPPPFHLLDGSAGQLKRAGALGELVDMLARQQRNMKVPMHRLIFLGVAALALAANLYPQPKELKAEVWEVRGSATYSIGGRTQPLKLGTVLSAGAVVKTGPGCAVDLHLGKQSGVLRLAENTTLGLDKLVTAETSAGTTVEIQLNLPEGTVLGDVRKLHPASKYEVKLSNGIASIREGALRLNAQGYLVLLDGTLLFVGVPAAGEPMLHRLAAPPPVYFSPTEGIKSAPPALVREVQKQLQTSLPAH